MSTWTDSLVKPLIMVTTTWLTVVGWAAPRPWLVDLVAEAASPWLR